LPNFGDDTRFIGDFSHIQNMRYYAKERSEFMENFFHIHSEDMPIAPYRYI